MHHRVKLLTSSLALLALLSLAGPAGCFSSGPVAPSEWRSPSDAVTDPADFDQSSPALQVLICQGKRAGTHTGLRILRPSRPIIFWDPAGQFGWGREDLRRSRDVFAENAPGMAEYIRWRFQGADDAAVTLFEWRLTPQQADALADVLTHEAVVPQGEVEFETSTVGLFCCHAVSKYLDRFAKDLVTIPTYWFRPEALGDHLWSQHPDRVAIFHADGTTEVFTAPPRR